MTGRRPALMLAVVLAAVIVAGCSVPLLGTRTPPRLFDLAPPSDFTGAAPPVTWQLGVAEPIAGRALDTDRIALRPDAHELRYYGGARWADRAPRMLQSLLVDSFERSGRIVRVARQSIGFAGDYELHAEIRAFEARLPPGAAGGIPRVHVRLVLRLVRAPRGKIVDTVTLESEAPASGREIEQVVAAFERAVQDVCRKAVAWTIERGEADRVSASRTRTGSGRPTG
ncbi:MAG: hypothetical protein D6738_05260 [Acidobacteria bacterium]|nr:MAG: hypothetical protein D6738_05260 [Acidobacteriota bacterium]